MASKDAPIRQNQLLLPLLATLEEAGESLPTAALYDQIATRLGMTADQRATTTTISGRKVNKFAHDVRWAQQRAKFLALADHPERNTWRITAKGTRALTEARPGKVITIFETSKGIAIWANIEDAIGYIDSRSVNLFLTSPPYPLLRQKQYGLNTPLSYVDWLSKILGQCGDKLTDDGSIVLNLADAWIAGEPSLSLYQEELLVKLCQTEGWKLVERFAWHNPAKLPAPAAWVTVRRLRVKPALEQIYVLARSAFPYTKQKAVLQPYSPAMKRVLQAGGQAAATRPSGHAITAQAFATDHGRAIPPNLITVPNTVSNDAYSTALRKAGLPLHPARFPAAIPEFFIKYLSREDDLVADPFAGSFTTAAIAEKLNRRWIGIERIRQYIEGAAFRFGAPLPAA